MPDEDFSEDSSAVDFFSIHQITVNSEEEKNNNKDTTAIKENDDGVIEHQEANCDTKKSYR